MISNQILQSTIDGLKNIARVEFCVMDADGKEVASTTEMNNISKTVAEFAMSPADSQEIQGYQFFSGIVRRKVPADVFTGVVSIRFPCRQFPPEFVDVCYPP